MRGTRGRTACEFLAPFLPIHTYFFLMFFFVHLQSDEQYTYWFYSIEKVSCVEGLCFATRTFAWQCSVCPSPAIVRSARLGVCGEGGGGNACVFSILANTTFLLF